MKGPDLSLSLDHSAIDRLHETITAVRGLLGDCKYDTRRLMQVLICAFVLLSVINDGRVLYQRFVPSQLPYVNWYHGYNHRFPGGFKSSQTVRE